MEEPKSPLGYALYKYDKVLEKGLHAVIRAMEEQKSLRKKKAQSLIKDSLSRLEAVKDEVSKERLKLDYKSDKARDIMLDMVGNLIGSLKALEQKDYVDEKGDIAQSFTKSLDLRQVLKAKLKDAGSDYL